MNWENLKTNQCPHCSAELYHEGYASHYRCSRCHFHIDPIRFMKISTHRAHPEREFFKIKWQNLNNSRCPLCSQELYPKPGPYNVLHCLSESCTFNVREDRLNMMKNDPNHPVNRFKDHD